MLLILGYTNIKSVELRSALPRTQHDCHHDTKVKPETATAVIELLMMGGESQKHAELQTNFRIINRKIVASGW
jgi:hypothetical protein